jgi:hypothetical protein
MMIGQLVRERSGPRFEARFLPQRRIGVIMDIDPLRRGVPSERPPGEIVILLTNGQLWHADPLYWEVISEPCK